MLSGKKDIQKKDSPIKKIFQEIWKKGPSKDKALSSFQVQDFPVYTMKKDLEQKKGKSQDENPENNLPQEKIIETKEAPSTPPPSPFLTQEKWEKKEEWKGEEKSIYLEEEGLEKKKLAKISIIVFFLSVIIVSAGAGYYFWKNKFNQKYENIPLLPIKKENAPAPSPAIPQFSKENPNYFQIDAENATGADLKEILNKKAQEVVEANLSPLVEFVLTDKNNNPVSFAVFSQKIGMNLPEEILDNLGSSFGFFVVNENGRHSFGLSVPSKNDVQLKAALLQNEADLAKNMEPLFTVSQYSLSAAKFSSSSYNGSDIRFFNIVSPEELSIDYAISHNHLEIGHTKLAIRSILDYIYKKYQEIPQ